MSNSGFEEMVGFNRTIMKLTGIWPYSTSKWSSLKFFISFFFMTFFICIPQTHKLFLVKANLNEAIEVLTVANLMVGIACFKLTSAYYNKRDLGKLLRIMEHDWKTEEKTKLDKMKKNMAIVKFMVRFAMYSATGSVTLHTICRLVIINFYQDENSTSRLLYLSSEFIFNVQKSPIYEIVWVCQFMAGAFAAFAFANFDGFFIFIVFHLCAQLEILRSEIRNLSIQSKKQPFLLALRPIIRKHLHLKRLSHSIEESFNRVFLVQMLCYSVTICLQGYQLIVSLGGDIQKNLIAVIFIVVFTLANIFSLLIYCLVSEMLRTESLKIGVDVYNVNWYELPAKEARMLIIIMCATQTPLVITAGKFAELSLQYFMLVLKSAVGYLSMLLVIKSKV